MKTFQECLADDQKDWLGLTKITGQTIKEVEGYISKEYDDPVFMMTNIILEDGTKISCEGEHDMPYLSPYKAEKIHMDEDSLNHIYKTDPDHADEEQD